MSIINEFKKFMIRGNFADMAVGFTVGAAFTTVVKSAVDDLVMPVVGLATGRVDFSQKFLVLLPGDPAPPYTTRELADQAGAITLNYGNFINSCFSLFVVALFLFFVVRAINRIDDLMEEEAGAQAQEPDEPKHKKCPFCMATIAYKAVRCEKCTTELEGFRARRDAKPAARSEIGAGTSADG